MFAKPLFCFLLALHVPLTFFADNQGLFEFSGVIRTLLAFQIFTVVLYFLGKRISGSSLYAIAFASVPLIFFWVLSFGVAYAFLASAIGGIVFLILGRFLNHQKIIMAMNIGILVVLFQPIVQIAFFQISPQTASNIFVGQDFLLPTRRGGFADDPIPKHQSQPPSILHITLDAYASDAVLSEVMGVDNSNYSTALESMGFTIFENAVAPYNQTLLSMAAVFSGTYLDVDALASEPSIDMTKIFLALQMRGGSIRKTLKNIGYSFAYNENGYYSGQSYYPKGSLINEGRFSIYALSNFENTFLVQPWHRLYQDAVRRYTELVDSFGSSDSEKPVLSDSQKTSQLPFLYIKELKQSFDSSFMKRLEPPFLYYLHVLSPHPPFTIDRNGNPTMKWSKNFEGMAGGSHAHKMQPNLQEEYARGYREKLLYTNHSTLEYVRQALELLPGPLIIVIHGDHGSGVLQNVNAPDSSCLRERFSPYLAIYSSSPEVRTRLGEYASSPFNLTNIYPLIFDEIFEQKVELEENHSLFVPWKKYQDYTVVDQDKLGEKCDLPWQLK